LPAIVSGNHRQWYLDGVRHRECDLPAVVIGDRWSSWWRNGVLHRDGGRPAVINSRSYEWWVEGVLVRSSDMSMEEDSLHSPTSSSSPQ
jgi:hypothetical protein